MKTPLVSLIIPICGPYDYLEAALTSVAAQTYASLEVILLDSHFTLPSSSIIQEFIKSTKYKCIYLQENFQTLAEAINRGLGIAQGDYLTFLSPQDYFAPNRIERLVDKAIASQMHFIFTRVDLVDQDSRRHCFDASQKRIYEEKMFEVIQLEHIEEAFMTFNLAMTYGNMFFSQELYTSVGVYKEYKYQGSLDYIVRSLINYEISFLNENLYYYRYIEEKVSQEELELSHKEREELYLNYFVTVTRSAPLNKNAPSPYEGSKAFLKAKNAINLGSILTRFISTPKIIKFDSSSVNFKNNFSHYSGKSEKFTLITHDLAPGGGGSKLVLDLAIALKGQGYKVSVISMREGPLKNEYEKFNIPLFIAPAGCLKWDEPIGKWKRLGALIWVTLYLNLRASSTVIVNSAASSALMLPLLLFAPFKKVYWYIHESFSPTIYLKTNLAFHLLKRVSYKKRFNFWFGSESTKNIWNSILDVSGKVLYWSGLKGGCLSLASHKPIKNLLSIGFSTPRKGFHLLVDAFIACIKKGLIPEDVSLTLVGLPDSLDSYNQDIILKILSANLQERIHLISCIDIHQLDSFYNEADLFIQSSVLECLPLSLLQAMSLGVPIISTDVNGCSEAIVHNYSGYLCRSFSAKALEKALVETINHPLRTRQLAFNAQRTFNEKFSLEITISKIKEELSLKSKSPPNVL
jgi:glycosyltransferase involved in cell wall biosynthesis